MADMTIEEIEELATIIHHAAERGESGDGYARIGNTIAFKAASALRQFLNAQRWRPIKSAPKDGTPVLLWAPDYFEDEPHAVVGEWCDRVGAWSSEVGMMEDWPIGDDPDACNGPTHWLPLPSPPEEKENGDG